MKDREKHRDEQSRRRQPNTGRFSREDYERSRHQRHDVNQQRYDANQRYYQDQSREDFEARDASYGTGVDRSDDLDSYQRGGEGYGQRSYESGHEREGSWNENPDYTERSRRRLSIGSERPYSSQGPRHYPSEYGPGSYYGQHQGASAPHEPSYRGSSFDRSFSGSSYGRSREERPYSARSDYNESFGFGRHSQDRDQDREQDRGFSGRGPKGYQRSDERIREEVCDRLADHPGVDASEIEVKVEKGHITLTGTVQDRRAKRLAEDVTEQIRGVSDVSNQIRVQATFDQSESSSTNLGAKPTSEKPKGDVLHS